MPTFMQKLTLAWRGWMRRQSSRAAEKNDAFVRQASSWGAATPGASPGVTRRDSSKFDLEGLQVAWLDDSGRIEHYLDVDTGEVVEFLGAEREEHPEVIRDALRYRRIPTRDAESEATERIAFLDEAGCAPLREPLRRCVASAADFRKTLSADRRVEKAWYNFRNDAATRAIETWLGSL